MIKNYFLMFVFMTALVGCTDGVDKKTKNNTELTPHAQNPQTEKLDKPKKIVSDKEQIKPTPKIRLSETDKQQYTKEQQELLEKHLELFNNPELVSSLAKQLENERGIQQQKLIADLEGNGLSYLLGNKHLILHGQSYQSIAKGRCVSMEDIIKSNPKISGGKNRIMAPTLGFVLNLPDHACADDFSIKSGD